MTLRKPDVTEAEIRTWCGDYIAKTLRLRRDRIDDEANFASYGLDSAESVFMITALEDWLGVELDFETAVEHPSIAELAQFVMTLVAQANGRAGR